MNNLCERGLGTNPFVSVVSCFYFSCWSYSQHVLLVTAASASVVSGWGLEDLMVCSCYRLIYEITYTQFIVQQFERFFVAQTFWIPPGVRDIPAKFLGHPRFLSSKPKEDKLSREGTNFSATTPSRGRPPTPHRAVSGPEKLIFVLFFLAW